MQGRSLNDLVNEQSSDTALPTSVSEVFEVLDAPKPVTLNPAYTGLATDSKSIVDPRLANSLLNEKSKNDGFRVSDAIFERFTADADKAIRDADFELPVDADSLIEQVEKPIIEMSEALVEDGEPILLKFRLKPAELGMVEIRLEKNAAGKLSVHFQTESEIATKVLNESFDRLRHALQDSGWSIDEMNASNKNAGENAFNQQQQQRNDQTRRNNVLAFSSDAESEAQDSESEHSDIDNERLVSIRA